MSTWRVAGKNLVDLTRVKTSAITADLLADTIQYGKDFVFDATKADMNKFDKFIDEIEPGALRIPVLIKKYVKQNARLVAFNVDPKFNNAIDGLMYIRVADIPESTVKPVMEEFQAELEKKLENEKNEDEVNGTPSSVS